MFCTKCGSQLSDSSRFCPKCGASVGTKPSSSFFDTVKRNMNNSKIAILILNGILFLSMFVVPYFYIVVELGLSKTSYPIRLIGGNDYPSSCPFKEDSDIGWTFLLFAVIGAIGFIVYSLLVNKYKFCIIASIANLVLSCIGFYSFLIPMINSRDKYTSMAPIGALIHIGLSIAILVLTIKLMKKERKSSQTGHVIFR